MKKKCLNFCLAFILIIPTIFLLSACREQQSPDGNSPGEIKVYDDFVFDGNKFTGYMGKDTELVIPSSYSIHNTESDVYTMEYNIRDIINYGDESSLDYEIWAEDISDFDMSILVGGMYNASVNNGEKQYVRVGEAEEYFTTIKETYTDPNTTISIELTDYTLTPEDQVDQSNIFIIMRPYIEMVTGKLESFSIEYNNKVTNFTKDNYMQNTAIFGEILSESISSDGIKYDVGNYIEFVEGNDYKVENIASITPDQALGGGLFNIPQLTTLAIPSSVKTIENGVFESITTLTTVIIESDEIYNLLTDTSACGALISNATTIKVLKEIVDNTENVNEFLNTNGGYTKSLVDNYYVYTK